MSYNQKVVDMLVADQLRKVQLDEVLKRVSPQTAIDSIIDKSKMKESLLKDGDLR